MVEVEREDNEDVLLLQEGNCTMESDGQGAAILSLRSQMKLIPEVESNIASEGKLGKRQPDSAARNVGSFVNNERNGQRIQISMSAQYLDLKFLHLRFGRHILFARNVGSDLKWLRNHIFVK